MNKKNQFYKLIISVFLTSLTFLSTSYAQDKIYNQNFSFKIKKKINGLELSNTNNKPAFFSMLLNDYFPLTENKILKDIQQWSTEKGVPEIEAAWEYLISLSYHHDFVSPYNENWINNPEFFINSIGKALCDNLAANLAKLWQLMGYQARIIGLNGHVVPEVKDKDGWHMLDPDHRVYYRDSTEKILSVEELAENPNYILDPTQNSKLDFNPFFYLPVLKTKKIACYYASKHDNIDLTESDINNRTLDMNWIIPAKTKITIVSKRKNKITNNYLMVHLSEDSKGVLQIPLAPSYIEGKMTFHINNDSELQTSQNWYRFETRNRVEKMTIDQVLTPSIIYYEINDKLNLFHKSNKIKVNTDLKLKLKKAVIPDNIYDSINVFHPNLIYDQYGKKHFNFLDQLSQLSDESTYLTTYIYEKYKLFLKEETLLDKTNQEKKLINMQHLLTQFLDNEQFYNVIKNTFPEVIMKLFVIHLYDTENKLPQYLKNEFKHQ